MAATLNPDIRNMEYGKREIKSLQIFPLSIRDQFKLSNMVTSVVTGLVDSQEEYQFSDAAFMRQVMESIESNITEILCVMADIKKEEADEIIDAMTNTQLLELVEIIWIVNYEPAIKKGRDLFERGRNLFPSKRSSAPSLSGSPSID